MTGTGIGLERVIRAVQPIKIGLLAPRRGFTTLGPEIPDLEWGSPGRSVFQISVAVFNEVVEYKEQSRTVDVARVKNENDDNQYVDVETVKSTTIRASNGQKQVTTYTPLKAQQNIEIIKKNVVISS